MHKSAFALLCLTCLELSCRAQSSIAANGNSRTSLANLLLAINPSISVTAPTAKHRIGQRAPVANMQSPLQATEEEDEFLSEEQQENLKQAAFLFMRIAAAAVMIHHGEEKLLSTTAFTKYTIDKYFGFLPGPHIFYTYASGWVQFLAPIFLSLGVFSRIAGVSLAGTMLGALFYSKVAIGLEGFPMFELRGLAQELPYKVAVFHNYSFETPALYLVIFLLIAASGPGKFSIAQLLGWNDDKTILGKIKQ